MGPKPALLLSLYQGRAGEEEDDIKQGNATQDDQDNVEWVFWPPIFHGGRNDHAWQMMTQCLFHYTGFAASGDIQDDLSNRGTTGIDVECQRPGQDPNRRKEATNYRKWLFGKEEGCVSIVLSKSTVLLVDWFGCLCGNCLTKNDPRLANRKTDANVSKSAEIAIPKAAKIPKVAKKTLS